MFRRRLRSVVVLPVFGLVVIFPKWKALWLSLADGVARLDEAGSAPDAMHPGDDWQGDPLDDGYERLG